MAIRWNTIFTFPRTVFMMSAISLIFIPHYSVLEVNILQLLSLLPPWDCLLVPWEGMNWFRCTTAILLSFNVGKSSMSSRCSYISGSLAVSNPLFRLDSNQFLYNDQSFSAAWFLLLKKGIHHVLHWDGFGLHALYEQLSWRLMQWYRCWRNIKDSLQHWY
jgi:hypothetical protein